MNKRVAITSLAVSVALVTFTAKREGFSSIAYRDSGGVWTIGYGQTKGIKQGDTTTKQRALVDLQESLNIYADGVKKCLQNVTLYQYEFDALVDVSYNAGIYAVCHSPMAQYAKQGDYTNMCESLKGWYVYDKKGHYLHGLVDAREREYQMCIGNKP